MGHFYHVRVFDEGIAVCLWNFGNISKEEILKSRWAKTAEILNIGVATRNRNNFLKALKLSEGEGTYSSLKH